MIVVAVDIGSTWTKGAAFEVDADEHVRLLDRAARRGLNDDEID